VESAMVAAIVVQMIAVCLEKELKSLDLWKRVLKTKINPKTNNQVPKRKRLSAITLMNISRIELQNNIGFKQDKYLS